MTRSSKSLTLRAARPVRGRESRNCTVSRWLRPHPGRARVRTPRAAWARVIQQGGLGRKQPVLQFADQLLFPGASSTCAKRSRLAYGCSSPGTGRCAAGKEKPVLPTGGPLRVEQTRPPILSGKIPPGQNEFLKIVLQQQPARWGSAHRQTAGAILRGQSPNCGYRPVHAVNLRTLRRFARAPNDARRTCWRPPPAHGSRF